MTQTTIFIIKKLFKNIIETMKSELIYLSSLLIFVLKGRYR